MEQGQNRNQYKLRFHIDRNTQEWQNIKTKCSFLWEEDSQHYLVCISRPQNSKLSHYIADPIKDDSFAVEQMNKKTTVYEIIRKVKQGLKVNPWKSIIISHKGHILNPNTTIGELQPEYGPVVFLTYREQEAFG